LAHPASASSETTAIQAMTWRMRSLPCFRSHGPEDETADCRLIFIARAIFVTDCGWRVMLADATVAHPKKKAPAMSGGGGMGGTDY
jgi:hypothetical protein